MVQDVIKANSVQVFFSDGTGKKKPAAFIFLEHSRSIIEQFDNKFKIQSPSRISAVLNVFALNVSLITQMTLLTNANFQLHPCNRLLQLFETKISLPHRFVLCPFLSHIKGRHYFEHLDRLFSQGIKTT